jgi:hypothetical protein
MANKFHQLSEIEPNLEDDTSRGYSYGKPMRSTSQTAKAKKKKGKKKSKWRK